MSTPRFRPHHQGWLKRLAGDLFTDLQVIPKSEISMVSAQAGIYALLGYDCQIIHMGKALRNGGIRARLDDHMGIPERRKATEQVMILSLDALIEPARLLAIEGAAADLLRLRGNIPRKKWPHP